MSSSGETSDLKLLKELKCGRLFLWWIRKVDIVVSVCKKASGELLKNGFSEKKLVEIPNGVDTKRFCKSNVMRKKGIRNIIYIGRLDSYKGVDYLLKGFRELLAKVDKVKLTIVGDGVDKAQLTNMAEYLGIQDSVTFKGRQEDIPRELYNTDIFVLPSLSEGMSNVVLEAMACGLPVVATFVGGNSDLIRDRYNGILIPPKDSVSLTAALLELIENENFARRLGEEARKTIEKDYSMDQVVSKYVELYNRLVNNQEKNTTS